MAENKYDLLLLPRRDSNLKIKRQPWYRERLITKYEKKPPLSASSWTFIKEGVDDFRDGKPPVIDSSLLVRGSKGLQPGLFGEPPSNKKEKLSKGLAKNDIVYSKRTPSQQYRKERVDDVEKKLLEHPLALYPHIEEAVAPDVFDDLIDLLDPSLILQDDDLVSDEDLPNYLWGGITPLSSDNGNTVEKQPSAESQSREACVGYNKAMRDQRKHYKKLAETAEEENENKQKSRKSHQHATKIDEVTGEFCDWVRGLGGDTNNIEEGTVKNLFASGYDTKPTLSVPVHVVELTNVPPELRTDVDLAAAEHIVATENKEKGTSPDVGVKSQSAKSYMPSWVKVEYGAWYLKPKNWKARPKNIPLQDPKEIEGKMMSQAKSKSKALDKVLAGLHGAKAFRAFVDVKGARNPEFLESVSGILDDDKLINVGNK